MTHFAWIDLAYVFLAGMTCVPCQIYGGWELTGFVALIDAAIIFAIESDEGWRWR